MKIFIAFAACILAAYAAEVEILKNVAEVHPDGSYQYAYETGNGIAAQESGALKDPETIAAHGEFSYTSPEGEAVKIVYTADENGFSPSGSHIPVAPETPPHILRALEYIASHPPHEEHHGRH